MKNENLFTNGSEFKLPNGRRYRGFYHLHPTKGAMVGSVHTDRQHTELQPLNKIVRQKMQKNSAPVTSTPVETRTITATQQPERRVVRPAPRSTSVTRGGSGY